MMNEERLKIAVLIDADNMPARCMAQLMTWVAEHGEVKLWRAYGNINTFKSPDCDWVKAAGKHGIDVRVLLPVMDGKKNTADSAMMLDAMELALTGQCEALCLVSHDSDFRQLALKLKARMPVYGLVMGDVPESYLAALTEYSTFTGTSEMPTPPPSEAVAPQASETITQPPSETAAPPPSEKAAPPPSEKAAPPPGEKKQQQKPKKTNPLETVLLSAFQSACGDKEFCLKTMLGSKLSSMRSQLPKPLCSTKKNLLNKVLNEMRKQCGYDLFVEEGSKQNTIVRLKKKNK